MWADGPGRVCPRPTRAGAHWPVRREAKSRMSIQFNADEIFEIAEQIERNGAKFYRRGADILTEPENRRLLLDLAAMEDEHERVFAAMRTDVTASEREPVVFDPDDQGALYLRAMADGHVFDVKVDPSERLKGKETMDAVFEMAIGLEKDSILFYLGMKEIVPERLGRHRVDAIIREEMGHVALLSSKLSSLRP